MIDTIVRDPSGRDRIIKNIDDINRLTGEVERRRDELAVLMLGADHETAANAEKQSDYIEDVFLPLFEAELKRVQALLDADAAIERRRAKARAIKERHA